MASAMEATSVLALKFQNCSHIDKKSVMMAIPNRLMFSTELYEMYHRPCDQLMASIRSSMPVFIYESYHYYIKKNSNNTLNMQHKTNRQFSLRNFFKDQ
jgi:hypothetical protein